MLDSSISSALFVHCNSLILHCCGTVVVLLCSNNNSGGEKKCRKTNFANSLALFNAVALKQNLTFLDNISGHSIVSCLLNLVDNACGMWENSLYGYNRNHYETFKHFKYRGSIKNGALEENLGCVGDENNDTDLLHPAFTTNTKTAAVVGKNIFP